MNEWKWVSIHMDTSNIVVANNPDRAELIFTLSYEELNPARYVIQLKKSLTGTIEKIPISPELGLMGSLIVFKKDFCPSISSIGNFRISSNCTFLTGDVCNYICEGLSNDSSVAGSAECSASKEWVSLADDPNDINTQCKVKVETTTNIEIATRDKTQMTQSQGKDEKNDAAIVLGVLFSLTLCGFISMLAFFIKRRITKGKGVIIDHSPNIRYNVTRNMNEI